MILITGAGGFVGKAVHALLPDAMVPSSRQLDLTDQAAVESFVAEVRPQVVVHLAARVGGITANIARPADFLVDNLQIDSHLLAALRRHRPEHLVSMLSTCMYPDRLDDASYPMDESLIEAGPPPPTNAAYAAAKRSLWHGTRALHDQYGVRYTALVPANLYGPGDHFGTADSHFVAAAVHKIESARAGNAKRVEFFGTGRAIRQYVFVEDLARLVETIVRKGPLDETVNVAPRESKTIRELAEATAEAAGYRGQISFEGMGPDGQMLKDVDSSRLRELVPEWDDIETPFAEGIRRTIEAYRADVAAR
jgi:GDP-L-fucose synthase